MGMREKHPKAAELAKDAIENLTALVTELLGDQGHTVYGNIVLNTDSKKPSLPGTWYIMEDCTVKKGPYVFHVMYVKDCKGSACLLGRIPIEDLPRRLTNHVDFATKCLRKGLVTHDQVRRKSVDECGLPGQIIKDYNTDTTLRKKVDEEIRAELDTLARQVIETAIELRPLNSDEACNIAEFLAHPEISPEVRVQCVRRYSEHCSWYHNKQSNASLVSEALAIILAETVEDVFREGKEDAND